MVFTADLFFANLAVFALHIPLRKHVFFAMLISAILQGRVSAVLLDNSGSVVVKYSYDAWCNCQVLFITIDDLSYLNPDSVNGLNLYAYCQKNPIYKQIPLIILMF